MNPNLVPPTPTFLPPAPPIPIHINAAQWRIWSAVDEGIMIWQQIGPAKTQVIQVAIIVAIVLFFALIVIRSLQSMTEV